MWSRADSSNYVSEVSLGPCVQAVTGAHSVLAGVGGVIFGSPQAVAFHKCAGMFCVPVVN